MSVIGHGVEVCTTATRPASPSNGTLIFDTDTNQLLVRVGSSWVDPMNNQTAGGSLTGTYPNPTYRASHAGKQGPTSLASAYRNNWAKGYGNGTELDSTTYGDGIYVNTTGYYECWGAQRCSGGNSYFGLAINGNRTTLETRTSGLWSHDHSTGNNDWAISMFMGVLYAGEKVTGGGPSTTYQVYGTNGFAGFITIKYLGQ